MTAPATPEGEKHGYVFMDCNLTADQNVKRVYLSRPWRPFAQAIYIRCNLGKHIVPEGWNNWGKTSNEQTVNYAEYQSTGEGANPSARTGYSRQLIDITPYSIQSVLGGNDNWNPTDN